MMNRYANLINILHELEKLNPNVPKLREDLRTEIEDGNIHEYEFVEPMEDLLRNLDADSIDMELVENLLHEAEQAQKSEHDYEDQLANPMHVDCDYVAWNFDPSKRTMVSLLKKRTIRKFEYEGAEKCIRTIIDSRQVPADIALMLHELIGEYGLIYSVVKAKEELSMLKRMAELRTKCKLILKSIKESEQFDAEFGIEWH